MQMRDLGRVVGTLVFVGLAGAVGSACGGASNQFDGGASSVEAGSPGLSFSGDGSVLGSSCVPKMCADLEYTCGKNSNGCGGVVDCGTCVSPEFCGGGGYSKCGTTPTWEQDGGADGGLATSCVPKACSDLGYDCGYAGDGCGNSLNCGGVTACSLPAHCGGGGPQKCGGDVNVGPDGAAASLCTPKACADYGYDCGFAGDGCGNSLNCGGQGACSGGQYCGGGGANKCGGSVFVSADGSAVNTCTPTTCAQLGMDCGFAGDGCGGQLNCGGANACALPEYCGGGGPNKCGGSVYVSGDGGSVSLCTPTTCAKLGMNCGFAGDGCGGQLNCGGAGACVLPQYCGGGGPNVCGGSVYVGTDGGTVNLCASKTCSQLGYNCGPAGDGCGNLLNCGASCPGAQYCGGGGPNVCGGSVFVGADGGSVTLCAPTTCQALGFNCGPASDGCGNLLQCGNCYGADTCGGGGSAGVCGHTCGGLCQYQASCMSGTPTTITGRVLAGASAWTGLAPDPVPNVLVYVPNGTVLPLSQGYTQGSCPQCGSDVSGNPLVSTYTNFDGTFTLTNVPTPPAGQTVTLVIQLGRWRRQLTIPPPAACMVTPVGDLNLPSNHMQGDIPLTAISTGAVDALECVLMKMGVDQAEFTSSTASPAGRIHIYAKGPGSEIANGVGPGAYIADPASKKNPPAALSQPESALMAKGGTYMGYDQIMLPCWGSPVDFKPKDTNNMRSAEEPGDLITYADSGGHFFATHYSYSWLVNNGEFNNVAKWNPDENNPGGVNWTLNVSKVPPVVQAPMHSGVFWQWLNILPALSNANATNPPQNPQVLISNPRHDVDAVTNGSLDWIDGTDPDKKNAMVEHFTFNTPVGQANQCGHAIFSDFHVASQVDANSTAFPNECTKSFTAQERILEYMIFDLASCVTPPQSSCTPLSCSAQGLSCGPAGDGCGNQINCGTCVSPLVCGGGGVRGQCGEPDGGACTPASCAQQGIACGPAGDGCGNVIQCGACQNGQTCGGGGVTGQCGEPGGGVCSPLTCGVQGLACGPAGDGCGNVIQCGTCPTGQMCGGGGVSGQCGAPSGGACVPLSCAAQSIACGPAGDGCGNSVQCGGCPTGQTCGGGGRPGQCGAPDGGSCVPLSCAAQNIGCGPAGDGCGNAIQCASCPEGEICGGGGVPGQCGAPDSGSCVPLTCAGQQIACGPAGDGCGNGIDCGTCNEGTCGGGGTPGQCGQPNTGHCLPQTCADQQISCGPAGDGCGNAIQCGNCPSGQTCGGGGTPGQCAGGTCQPYTCAGLGYNCGPAGDGCGALLACGQCVAPQTCGGGGAAGQCGSSGPR